MLENGDELMKKVFALDRSYFKTKLSAEDMNFDNKKDNYSPLQLGSIGNTNQIIASTKLNI